MRRSKVLVWETAFQLAELPLVFALVFRQKHDLMATTNDLMATTNDLMATNLAFVPVPALFFAP